MGLANRLVAARPGAGRRAGARPRTGRRPQAALRSDRLSSYEQWAMSLEQALANEYRHGMAALETGELEGPRIDGEVLRVDRVHRAQVVQLRARCGIVVAWVAATRCRRTRSARACGARPSRIGLSWRSGGSDSREERMQLVDEALGGRQATLGGVDQRVEVAEQRLQVGRERAESCSVGLSSRAAGRSWVTSGFVVRAKRARRLTVSVDSRSNVGSAWKVSSSSLVARGGRREHAVGVRDQPLQLAVALAERVEHVAGVARRAGGRRPAGS